MLATGAVPLRDWLNLYNELAPCTPDSASVRLPDGEPSPHGRWAESAPFPVAQDELRAAPLGGVVYVGSGLEGGKTELGLRSLAGFYEFDPNGESFRRLPDFPSRVDHPVIVAHAGEVYAIGGWHDLEPTDEVWRFSPGSGEWTELPPLARPRAAAAGAVLDGRLWVVGGSEGRHSGRVEPSDAVEIFDFASGSWSEGPRLRSARHHHGAAVLDGKLWVVGGRGLVDVSLESVEVLDPESGEWSEGPALPLGAGGLSVDAVGEVLVAVGGGDDDEGWVTPAAWGLRAGAGSWTRLADLAVARHGHGSAAVGDTLYVFGGAPCPGYGRTDSVESLRIP